MYYECKMPASLIFSALDSSSAPLFRVSLMPEKAEISLEHPVLVTAMHDYSTWPCPES